MRASTSGKTPASARTGDLRRSERARSPPRGRSHSGGWIISEISNPFFADVIKGFETAASGSVKFCDRHSPGGTRAGDSNPDLQNRMTEVGPAGTHINLCSRQSSKSAEAGQQHRSTWARHKKRE
jgi:hypothetical protein